VRCVQPAAFLFGLILLAGLVPARPSLAQELDQELGRDAYEVDSSETRYLGPGRDWAVVGFPIDLLMTSAGGAPRLEVGLRFSLSPHIALTLRPMAVWYLPTDRRPGHGAGAGGSLVVSWYLSRPLAGPYVALQGGDMEAFRPDGRGRMAGASAIFGYAISYDNGALLDVGVGLGYWPRSGVLDSGIQLPEILSFRVATGFGFGTPSPPD